MSKEVMDCPVCGEEILTTAKKCKHCGEWLNKENKNKEHNEVNTEEKVFYEDENVKVTQSRFTVGTETYAMRNISSVTNFEIENSKIVPWIFIISGIISVFFIETIKWWNAVMVIGGIIWAILITNDFAVKISTNAGEPNTLISEDKEYIQKVVDAINEAIIYRG